MSEKRVEEKLSLYLNKFNNNTIYYNPNEHKLLKSVFKNCSKTGNGKGIPDRIIFDEINKTLIVIECKFDDIKSATNDLKIYESKMNKKNINSYRLYFVAFCLNTYKIYDETFNEYKKKLRPKNFYIKYDNYFNYTTSDMDKNISIIHNYIRDYTKISNEDKSFFIACILISLKDETFISNIDNLNNMESAYGLIYRILQNYSIDISVFDFLRNDENNKHFIHIIKLVHNVTINNNSIDLLNKFYKEFIKYNNSDGKSLGIVLTPEHIVQLMIELLEINENDIFLDLCTGTGSFPLETLKYNPKKIIACEYQNKLFNLLKCNMILRDVDLTKHSIIKGDCFQQNYKATKSAINPPYGTSGKKELDFIIKQLESVSEGGMVVSIIPMSVLNNTKFLKLKQKIISMSHVKTIINLNKLVFYPSASVHPCILLLEKGKKQDKTLFVNYENDSIVLQKHIGLIKNEQFEIYN